MSRNKTIVAYLMVVATILFLSCSDRQDKVPAGDIFDESNLPAAEKMIWEAVHAYDFDRVLMLADSFAMTGDISSVTANYYRGAAAVNNGKLKVAEKHLRNATADTVPDGADLRAYLKAKALLSRILSSESNYEGALQEALPTLKAMDSLGCKDYGDMSQLHIVIGECQQNLHMTAEAATSFTRAYDVLRKWMDADSTGKDTPRIIIRLDNISTSYIFTSDYARAKMWLEREDSALTVYNTKPEVVENQADMLRGSVSLDLAEVCQQLGQSQEAARHYDEYCTTSFSKQLVARINATDYLLLAGRYAEAADNYSSLDDVIAERNMDLSLDNIGTYLLPKMRANVLAGRKDSAVAVGMKIVECFDSALTRQKEDVAAELATVYDTQGKERQIAEQEMRLSRVRVLALVVAIIALTMFFFVIDIFRRRAAKRLAKVNAAKERMESELNIARNIQMSMVPSTFPDQKGLDMYASMTPAKEVGGDLYGYHILGDQIYFCIGDVSGKGVPASLFMAQVTRLFHALASQGMAPAEIANHMNVELSGEDNEQGMFVTMFICRLNLKLYLLEYCNAGHNPPVIGIDNGQLTNEEAPANSQLSTFNYQFLNVEPNAPIGLWPELKYVGESIESFKNRLLLLYTDGLNEAEDTEQKQFGEDHLLDILRHTHFNSAKQVIKILTDEVRRHRNGAEPNDDLTMMCVKLG